MMYPKLTGAMAALLLLMLLAACGDNGQPEEASLPSPVPSPLLPAEPSPAPFIANLRMTNPATVDINLLLAEDVTIACDHPEDAGMACDLNSLPHQIDVDVNASTFARWSLRLPEADFTLTGQEILGIDLRTDGELDINLYFVAEDGRRVYERLYRLDLVGESHSFRFPLTEIRDDTGALIGADLQEIQLVFEWADMAGTLWVDDIRLKSVWQESLSPPTLPDGISLPAGFQIAPIASQLQAMTQIDFVAEDTFLVSVQNGRIWRYQDLDGDGFFESRQLYASGFWEAVGVLYDPVDGAVWISERGELWRTQDTTGDGLADVMEARVTGLPWGRHRNNELHWNPVADPFTGEPAHSWIYFGLGSIGDVEEIEPLEEDRAVVEAFSATVLRFPRTGTSQADLEVVSRGNRNAYGLHWAPVPHPDSEEGVNWSLFAGENGPDFTFGPDEVNHIRWGHHFGFPHHFGMMTPEEEGSPYSSPVYEVTPHASANSLVYITHPDWPPAYRTLYVSLFGSVFSPDPVGQIVERIELTPVETATGLTYQGEPSPFITGLDRPLPMTLNPAGEMIVGDYASGLIYRIWYSGE